MGRLVPAPACKPPPSPSPDIRTHIAKVFVAGSSDPFDMFLSETLPAGPPDSALVVLCDLRDLTSLTAVPELVERAHILDCRSRWLIGLIPGDLERCVGTDETQASPLHIFFLFTRQAVAQANGLTYREITLEQAQELCFEIGNSVQGQV
ncbi:hypothetical protein HK405_004065 [Cladochytrium tenue]|nr:hypothetical protein HK405_004065 [Cladochytrium tenue]